MIYLVKYYQNRNEYTDLITKYDLENYTKANEFHKVEKVKNYVALVKMLKGCEVEYENIDYLLEIGKEALLVAECLEDTIKKSYKTIEDLKQAMARPLIEAFESVRIRDIKDKTYISAKGSSIGAVFRISKEQDGYRVNDFNLI